MKTKAAAIGSPDLTRILIVDDNRDIADTLAMILTKWGFNVWVVYNGEEAIKTAHEMMPDCVISDIGMPDLNGYQLAELFGHDDSFEGMLLIAISAYDDVARAKAAGFDYDLVKPADAIRLREILKESLTINKRLERASHVSAEN